MIPYDAEAEKSVLGAMLLNSQIRESVLSTLDSRDFYVPEHAAVYRAIRVLVERGQPVDRVTLAIPKELHADLMEACPASLSIRGYTARVGDFAACRRAMGVAEALGDSAEAGDLATVTTILGSAVEKIQAPMMETDPPLEASEVGELYDEPEWVVRDLLARGEVAFFVAKGGAGKTTLLSQIACTTSSGLHPWSRLRITPIRVLQIDCQDPTGMIGARARSMIRLAGDAYRHQWWIESRTQGLDLTSVRDQRWLEAKVAKVDADLVVMGPLYNCVRGGPGRPKHVEETAELAGSFLSEMITRRGCALILEAHAPHGDALRVRGSAYWEDWAAFGFGLASFDEMSLTERADAHAPPVLAGQRAMFARRFRGDRATGRDWPAWYVQGFSGQWPWQASGIPARVSELSERMDIA